MRSEQEMYDLILRVAREDERVRAVSISGSRANPNAKKDIFQDYDVVYYVTEFESFKAQPDWIDVFGERLIMQQPWSFSNETEDYFNYLIQFTDGTRIDLSMELVSDIPSVYAQTDGLDVALLDKDGILPAYPPANDTAFHIKPPTAQRFFEVCNEFFWVSCYVAKGIWRQELPYAMHMLNHYVRDSFETMTDWYIGTLHGFALSVGKCGKLYQELLPAELWSQFIKTYPSGSYDRVWDALFVMCELFQQFARAVAAQFGFSCAEDEWQRVLTYLQQVQNLPRA